MARQFPLQPLLDLARDRLDDATRHLGELIALECEGQRKLELLENYRREYESRFMDAARGGIDPGAWRNYSAFIGRLDEAIAAQRQQVERSRANTSSGKQQWMHERNRMKAFDTLSLRHRQQLQHLENKQEQRASDEHAARPRRGFYDVDS